MAEVQLAQSVKFCIKFGLEDSSTSDRAPAARSMHAQRCLRAAVTARRCERARGSCVRTPRTSGASCRRWGAQSAALSNLQGKVGQQQTRSVRHGKQMLCLDCRQMAHKGSYSHTHDCGGVQVMGSPQSSHFLLITSTEFGCELRAHCTHQRRLLSPCKPKLGACTQSGKQ